MRVIAIIADIDAGRCLCARCVELDRAFPREGYQLSLPIGSSGDRLESIPLPNPDAPASVNAGVSAPVAAQSRHRARGRRTGAVHD